MIKICPRCFREVSAVTYGDLNTDVIHTCDSGDTVLDQEDVVVTGNFIDEKTGVEVLKGQAGLQGAENKVQGTIAAHFGLKIHDFTERGNVNSTHRQRQHFETLNIGVGDYGKN